MVCHPCVSSSLYHTNCLNDADTEAGETLKDEFYSFPFPLAHAAVSTIIQDAWQDGTARLTSLRCGAYRYAMLYDIPIHYPSVMLDEWVIRLHHVHGVLVIANDDGIESGRGRRNLLYVCQNRRPAEPEGRRNNVRAQHAVPLLSWYNVVYTCEYSTRASTTSVLLTCSSRCL